MIITLSVFLFKFHHFCVTRLSGGLQYVPLETATRAPRATVDPALYIAPPLRFGSTGSHRSSIEHLSTEWRLILSY